MMNKQWSMFALSMMLLVLIVASILGFMVNIAHPIPWILVALLIAIPYIHKRVVAQRFVEWRDEYSVGIAAIDEDHKHLLHLINNLQTAAHYQTDASFVKEALNELVDYTKTHFQREEALMEENGYPEFAAHKQEHQTMIAKVDELIRHFEQAQDETVEDAVQFLKNWLVKHINGSDQAYSGFLREKGVH